MPDRDRFGRFVSGHNLKFRRTFRPNTGTFTPRGTPGRPGGKPLERYPIGHTYLCKKSGEMMVKRAGRHPYFPDRPAEVGHYVRRAVAVFEERHGPVPRGMAVLRIDGDRLNDDIDNLVLVTTGVVAMLNRGHWAAGRRSVSFSRLPRERDVRLAAIMTAVARWTAREAGREGLPLK